MINKALGQEVFISMENKFIFPLNNSFRVQYCSTQDYKIAKTGFIINLQFLQDTDPMQYLIIFFSKHKIEFV